MRCLVFILLLLFACSASAFVIRDIEVDGLERVTSGRFFAILPLKVGDEFNVTQTPEIVNLLYKTGLFDDVVLLEENGVLLIKVKERPGIIDLQIVGNTNIPEEALLEGLAQAKIEPGVVFDRLALGRIKRELEEQYYGIGKYGARISIEAIDLPDNQVRIIMDIHEGEAASIKGIKIIGNQRIKEETLLDVIASGTRSWYMFWSSDDEYAQAKLSADLDIIQNLYLNRGYLDFNIEDTRVTLSADKKDIYISIAIKEGGRYRVGEIALAGTYTLDKKTLLNQITLKKGEYFSRSEAIASGDRILFLLKDRGYAFAKVVPLPQTNVEDSTVDVAFIIQPQKKTYVGRINIKGNTTTSDSVLRREIRQQEGSEFSAGKVELSERRLRRLPYLEEASIKDFPVEGKDNQVDLDIEVKERLSGNFNIGAGYSNSSGAIFSFGITQENFLGTGNRVNFVFNNNDSDTNHTIGFHNPFYTLDGVSRSWSLSYRSSDYEDSDITDVLSSSSNELRANLSYGIPLSENDQLRLGGRLESISIDLSPNYNPDNPDGLENDAFDYNNLQNPKDLRYDPNRVEIIDCISKYDGRFNNVVANTSLDYDTRNRALFPTQGAKISTSLQLYTPLSDTKYIKGDYSQRHYFALDKDEDFVFNVRGRISYARAYSGSCIPYFDRFYAGGTKTVRGYANNSLGPKDKTEDNDPLGGNFRVLGNMDLIFPTDFLYDRKKLRMSVFTDVGNVFKSAEDFSTSDLRGSYGLQFQWLTAIGAVSFNFASVFGDDENDDTESFQFDLGTAY